MMTPSEAKALGGAGHLTAKKMGNDAVNRKASFKCHTAKKSATQRVTRKVVLPMSTVQALTFKFNELSKMNQVQKQKMTQSAVKNMLGVNGKPNTIKVVICRKPSAAKCKRTDDAMVKRRVSVRKFQGTDLDGKENCFYRNVHQKISEYEGLKKVSGDWAPIKKRTSKMQVPKILVDIDLSADNYSDHHSDNSGTNQSEIICEKHSISVRTAINLFEKSSNACAADKKHSGTGVKLQEMNCRQEVTDVRNGEEVDGRTEFAQEAKPKPIAAIKPILKKQEDKALRKTKLSPKDSINRKKYTAMKRESFKNDESTETEIGGFEDLKDERTEAEHSTAQVPSPISERLKNSSSLHKQVLLSNFTLITDEISLNEDKPEQETGNANQNLKPNTSFLWSKKEEVYAEKRPNKIDLPLPVPPEIIPKVAEVADSIYDDVRQIGVAAEEEFDKISDSDEEDPYDDIGTYRRTNENNSSLLREIRKKNIRNEMSSLKISEALYDNPDKSYYSYDDGEGERYQYISDATDTGKDIPKQTEFEMYQYIQNNNNNNIEDINNENNIYEDIQTIKSQLAGKAKTKGIYEDINCVSNSLEDNTSIINCYEAVYNGIYSNNDGTNAYIKSDLSDASNNSGRSAYEKSNSLYGMSAGNGDNSHCISLSEVTDPLKHSGFHLSVYNSPHPNSDTSQSNSDEWVEVSESESEETVYVVHERQRKARSGGNTWTQKERKRWKKLQKKSNFNIGKHISLLAITSTTVRC